MNDATTTLLDRIGEQAVAIHLREQTISELRARLEELEEQVRSQTAGLNDLRGALARAVEADAPRRRIDVVTVEETENKVAHLGHTVSTARKVPDLLRWLREPAGAADIINTDRAQLAALGARDGD